MIEVYEKFINQSPVIYPNEFNGIKKQRAKETANTHKDKLFMNLAEHWNTHLMRLFPFNFVPLRFTNVHCSNRPNGFDQRWMRAPANVTISMSTQCMNCVHYVSRAQFYLRQGFQNANRDEKRNGQLMTMIMKKTNVTNNNSIIYLKSNINPNVFLIFFFFWNFNAKNNGFWAKQFVIDF